MEEKQLEILFKKFLIDKGYPNGSLLSEVKLRTSGDGVFYPDLVILDIINKDYIGLVEFKTKIDQRVQVNVLGQFYKYFSLLGTQVIPAYLVFSISDKDFQILTLTKENTFEPITKEDFPSFETLSAKRLTEEKLKQREIEEKTLIEIKRKKNKSRQSAYFSIMSLIVGVTTSLIAIYIQQKGFNKPTDQVVNVNCCDSLDKKYENIENKIRNMENQQRIILNSPNKKGTIYINLNSLEKRVKVIEEGISNNPEKTLSILQIRQEIEFLKKEDNYSKELTQTKLDAIKAEIAVQNAWVLGILVTIIGTILSFVIPNLFPKRIDTE